MRNVLVFLLVIAAGVLCAAQGPAGADYSADEAAIKAVMTDRFLAGWNAHDAHLFASAFSEDADFTNVRGMSASGRATIEKLHAEIFERLFKQSHQTAEVKKIRFLKSDVAVADVRWEMTGALDADGKQRPYRTGLLALVFTKSGGQWLITVMHNAEFTPWVPAPSAPR